MKISNNNNNLLKKLTFPALKMRKKIQKIRHDFFKDLIFPALKKCNTIPNNKKKDLI